MTRKATSGHKLGQPSRDYPDLLSNKSKHCCPLKSFSFGFLVFSYDDMTVIEICLLTLQAEERANVVNCLFQGSIER